MRRADASHEREGGAHRGCDARTSRRTSNAPPGSPSACRSLRGRCRSGPCVRIRRRLRRAWRAPRLHPQTSLRGRKPCGGPRRGTMRTGEQCLPPRGRGEFLSAADAARDWRTTGQPPRAESRPRRDRLVARRPPGAAQPPFRLVEFARQIAQRQAPRARAQVSAIAQAVALGEGYRLTPPFSRARDRDIPCRENVVRTTRPPPSTAGRSSGKLGSSERWRSASSYRPDHISTIRDSSARPPGARCPSRPVGSIRLRSKHREGSPARLPP